LESFQHHLSHSFFPSTFTRCDLTPNPARNPVQSLTPSVFGKVVAGMPHIHAIGKLATDDKDKPISPVIITHCGELELRRPAVPTRSVSPVRKPSSRSRSRSRSPDVRRKHDSSDESEDESRRRRKERKREKREKRGREVKERKETLDELDAR